MLSNDVKPVFAEAKARCIPLQPQELPPNVWHTMAVDLFCDQTNPFTSVLDVYSRYPDAVLLANENTNTVFQALKQVFTLFGTP